MGSMDSEKLQQALQQIDEIIKQAWDVIVEFIESVTEVCGKVYGWARDVYHAHGAPYGDTHEGMMRWWHEALTIARLRQEADLLEQRHRLLAEMRL